jgi:predicted porin
MKKSLLALAVLGAFAGAATAQSSVTMYGLIDLGVGKPAGTANKGMFQAAGSRLGMRGSEDLGGGLKGLFNIETRFDADTGSAQNFNVTPTGSTTANANRFWGARSFVGLEGGFGQILLGREYTTSFLQAQVNADRWGWDTVVAGGATVGITGGGIGKVRNDSSLTYRISFSGLTIGAQIAEATDTINRFAKKPVNFAVSYGGGPIAAGLGHERTGNSGEQWTSGHFSYAFGAFKPAVFYGTGKKADGSKVKSAMLSLAATFGAGELRAMVGKRSTAGSSDISAIGLGYHHSLSKRTTLYTDFVRNSKLSSEKTGYDFGVKHVF